MGGLLTFVLAALRPDRIRAAVPFYGFPQGDDQPDYSRIAARIQGHMAEHDDYFTADDARSLETRLRGMGKDVALDIHPAGHGFMNEENPGGTHDAALAAQLWPQVTAFLHETLDA